MKWLYQQSVYCRYLSSKVRGCLSFKQGIRRRNQRQSLRSYIHTYIHPSIYPSIHPIIHPSIHASIQSCMHACMHAYIYAYIHTYIHSYIHTYIIWQSSRKRMERRRRQPSSPLNSCSLSSWRKPGQTFTTELFTCPPINIYGI